MTLSIITITYNDLAGIQLTAENIGQQSFQNFEWIVIDGGSTDGTQEFINALSRKPDIFVSEPDDGIYHAMNKGIAKASGEYLLFMNGGDTFHSPTTLEEALKFLFTEDVVYGDAMFLHKKGPKRWSYDDVMTLKRLYEYSINHQSTFIRTSLLKEKDYDVSYRYVADAKRFVELFLEGKSFRHIPMVISNYDTTGASSTNIELVNNERARFFEELLPPQTLDTLKDWATFQNKQCLQTRDFCEKSKLFKKMIRANLHLIRFLNGIFHIV